MRYLMSVVFILIGTYTHAQQLSSSKRSKLTKQIEEYKSCKSIADNNKNCFQQIGQLLNDLYQVTDFYNSDKERYMTISEIYDYLESTNQWKLLGKSYDQSVLEQAQQLANKNVTVVAVYLNEEKVGQLAYILPGNLTPSGSWKMKVPNSTALISSAPENSYSQRGLSYSFPRRILADVLIYTRNI